MALEPRELTMEAAASIPLVGLTVWQALVDRANLQAGQKVPIHAPARMECVPSQSNWPSTSVWRARIRTGVITPCHIIIYIKFKLFPVCGLAEQIAGSPGSDVTVHGCEVVMEKDVGGLSA